MSGTLRAREKWREMVSVVRSRYNEVPSRYNVVHSRLSKRGGTKVVQRWYKNHVPRPYNMVHVPLQAKRCKAGTKVVQHVLASCTRVVHRWYNVVQMHDVVHSVYNLVRTGYRSGTVQARTTSARHLTVPLVFGMGRAAFCNTAAASPNLSF